MSSMPINPNGTRNSIDDWISEFGQLSLSNLATTALNYTPFAYQLYDSGCILNGLDVLCINVTGGGKSGLIYIPALARKEMIILVIEPTNFLEHDMSRSLVAKGVTSIAINAEAQAAALREGRDLWKEAQDCRYQVIAISPESLRSSEFDKLLETPRFYKHWGLLVVDEVHLLDEWGQEFRPLYQDIWSVRSRGPDGLVVVALSATVEPGRQTEAVLKHLGFRRGKYHLDRRDCERYNVDFIFRNVKYSCTGHTFRDLDWLIPINMVKASDILKCLVYCETIEMGHRVVIYLRSLLPPHLKQHAHILIRHMHSLNCPDCKTEGLAALYESGDARKTALFVTTAILEVGIDVPDIDSVVLFPAPPSASSLVQRSGRPARGCGMHGKAIVYVKKTELDLAREYAAVIPSDPRLLRVQEATPDDPSSSVEPQTASPPSTTSQDQYIYPADTSLPPPPLVVKKSRKPAAKPPTTSSKAARGVCTSLLLVIAAHLRGLCITRQINIIYGNPNMTRDCGHCSSCAPQPLPQPRDLEEASPTIAPPTTAMVIVGTGPVNRIPGHRKVTQKDAEDISNRLLDAAYRLLYLNNMAQPYTLLISPKCFLPPNIIRAISSNLHLITSENILRSRLNSEGWRYLDSHGHGLWNAVSAIAVDIACIQDERHLVSLEKRRTTNQLKAEERENERVHADIVSKGLGHIKHVKLTLPKALESDTHLPHKPLASQSYTLNFPVKKRTLTSSSSSNISGPSKAQKRTKSDTAPTATRTRGKENNQEQK